MSTSVIISRTSIRDVGVISSLRTDEQLIDRFVIGCVSSNSVADNNLENISNQLRMLELWYILIMNGRAFQLYKSMIASYGKQTKAVYLYYPWANSIHHKLRNFARYRVLIDGVLIDHLKLLTSETVMFDMCYAIANGIVNLEIYINGCDEQYFDSHYMFYYLVHSCNPFLAVWFYVTWLITPNHYYLMALGQYCCSDRRSIIQSKIRLEKHLKSKVTLHWELIRKSMMIDHHDKLLRMSYHIVDGTFRFGATLNFIKDRYHTGIIKMFSLIFGQRLKAIHGDDHISFVQEYNYNCTNVIAHILHFVVCEIDIVTTFAELMNQRGSIYKEMQDRQNIDFNEQIVIQFGCIGPFIHGPCCIVGRTFQYSWNMKNGLLDGTAEYKNLNTKLKYRGEFKNDHIMYSYTEAYNLNGQEEKKKRICAAYKEGTLHGICRIDERVAAYNYGDLIV